MHQQLINRRNHCRHTINDFIRDAIQHLQDGSENITSMASRLGLRPQLLQRWLFPQESRQLDAKEEEACMLALLRDENRRLERECQRLRNVLITVVGVETEEKRGAGL